METTERARERVLMEERVISCLVIIMVYAVITVGRVAYKNPDEEAPGVFRRVESRVKIRRTKNIPRAL